MKLVNVHNQIMFIKTAKELGRRWGVLPYAQRPELRPPRLYKRTDQPDTVALPSVPQPERKKLKGLLASQSGWICWFRVRIYLLKDKWAGEHLTKHVTLTSGRLLAFALVMALNLLPNRSPTWSVHVLVLDSVFLFTLWRSELHVIGGDWAHMLWRHYLNVSGCSAVTVLIDWLIGLLIDWLVYLLIGLSVDWLVYLLIDLSIDWLIVGVGKQQTAMDW